jgi:hypothetical protein
MAVGTYRDYVGGMVGAAIGEPCRMVRFEVRMTIDTDEWSVRQTALASAISTSTDVDCDVCAPSVNVSTSRFRISRTAWPGRGAAPELFE